MKKNQFILLVIFTLSFTTIHAQDLKGFSKEKAMTFFGVDYSNTIYIGAEGFQDIDKIATEYPGIWNNLFQKEFKKFSLKKYLYKDDVSTSLKVIDSINSKITEEDFKLRMGNVIDESKLMTLDKAKQIALDYKFAYDKNKYGAVVFAAEYNKTKNRGRYILVVINLENNTVAYTKMLEGKTKGFGFRNFWAGSYYSALKSLKISYKKDVANL